MAGSNADAFAASIDPKERALYDAARAALGALADDRDINLVFSDVMMPGSMNGLDLAEEIRRRRPGIPIVMTTGYSAAAMKTARVEHTDVLSKPYEISDLDAALRSALDL